MKMLLHTLKPGDQFWQRYFYEVLQCEVVGDANNINFRMPRYTVKIKSGGRVGETFELFINEYVYDNYEEAYAEVIDRIKRKISNTAHEIVEKSRELKFLQRHLNQIKNSKQ